MIGARPSSVVARSRRTGCPAVPASTVAAIGVVQTRAGLVDHASTAGPCPAGLWSRRPALTVRPAVPLTLSPAAAGAFAPGTAVLLAVQDVRRGRPWRDRRASAQVRPGPGPPRGRPAGRGHRLRTGDSACRRPRRSARRPGARNRDDRPADSPSTARKALVIATAIRPGSNSAMLPFRRSTPIPAAAGASWRGVSGIWCCEPSGAVVITAVLVIALSSRAQSPATESSGAIKHESVSAGFARPALPPAPVGTDGQLPDTEDHGGDAAATARVARFAPTLPRGRATDAFQVRNASRRQVFGLVGNGIG